MKAKEIVGDLMMDYNHDPYGCTMNAFFEVCGYMLHEGMDIPYEWDYSPGMTDGSESIFLHPGYLPDADADDIEESMIHAGNLLLRLRERLVAAGKDY